MVKFVHVIPVACLRTNNKTQIPTTHAHYNTPLPYWGRSDYSVSQKIQDTKLLLLNSPNINRFSKKFTHGLGSTFATNSCLNIPTRLKHVATLHCEI